MSVSKNNCFNCKYCKINKYYECFCRLLDKLVDPSDTCEYNKELCNGC